MDPEIVILAAWMPVAGIVLAMCLYDDSTGGAESSALQQTGNANPRSAGET